MLIILVKQNKTYQGRLKMIKREGIIIARNKNKKFEKLHKIDKHAQKYQGNM